MRRLISTIVRKYFFLNVFFKCEPFLFPFICFIRSNDKVGNRFTIVHQTLEKKEMIWKRIIIIIMMIIIIIIIILMVTNQR